VRVARQATAVAAFALGASAAGAQVIEVQGGGSSLYSGYGGTLNVWANGFRGALGIGYIDGLRLSAFLERPMGRDTIRLGDDVVPITFASDVFGTTRALFVQGVGVRRGTPRTRVLAFGGMSAAALPSPFFSALRSEKGLGIVQLEHAVTPRTTLITHALFADRQTILQGLRWSAGDKLSLGLTGGVGANAPYGAGSFVVKRRHVDLKAAYIHMDDDFRRTTGPVPMQAEADRENAVLTIRPFQSLGFVRDVAITVAHQNFRQDSVAPGAPRRASVNQIFGTTRVAGLALAGGAFVSRAGADRTLSTYFSAGRAINSWLEGDFFLLQVLEPALARNVSPVLRLRELVSPRLSLLQVINHEDHRTSVAFGGSFTNGLSAVSLDYQIVHTPYRVLRPFTQTIALNVKLQLGTYQLNANSFVTPDGRVNYSGTGNTFFYMGDAAGGGRRSVELKFERFVVQGDVVDEEGHAVEGAAIEVGSDLVFTDSRGRVFQRVGASRALALRVSPEDFTLAGAWEVVEAPASVVPAVEARAPRQRIVVRRVRTPPA
jgi:hypothetical protein